MNGKDMGPDMEQRDPLNLNDHVKVSFEEVIGEPLAVRSLDGVWRCSYKCFNCTLDCCYKALSVLCGCPLAFCWACEYACLACCHVWYLTPCIKCYTVNMMVYRKFVMVFLETFLAPFCETCGLIFSRITVKNQS